jgi:hypothetical protein
MEETLDLKKLSLEEIQDLVNKNAEGLSIKLGVKVYGLLLNTGGFDSTDGDYVIGYYKVPTLYQKFTIFDNLNSGNKTLKGFQLLEQNLIKEHSDMKYFDKKDSNNDAIIIGASLDIINKCVTFCLNQVEEQKKSGE